MSLVFPVDYYELELPISKRKVKYRGFLAREEKRLLLAMETDSVEDKFNAVRGILEGCVQDLDVKNLPYPEAEYIFMNVRAKSVGEIADFNVGCGCSENANTRVSIDLRDVPLVIPKDFNTTVELSDRVYVVFKVPSFETVAKGVKSDGDSVVVDNLIEISIDDVVYDTKEQTKAEIEGFLESLPSSAWEKIDAFFDNLPKVKHSTTYKCSKCGDVKTLNIEGFENFFA